MEFTLTRMGYSVDELTLALIILGIVIGDAIKNRKKTYYGYQLLRIAAFSGSVNSFVLLSNQDKADLTLSGKKIDN